MGYSLTFSFYLFYAFCEHFTITGLILRKLWGVFPRQVHMISAYFMIYAKMKNSNNFTFDSGINLKLSHKQDIDMKNDSCDFHQNLTS